MKDLNIDFKDRTGFLIKIGTQVAMEMSKGLQNLSGRVIKK